MLYNCYWLDKYDIHFLTIVGNLRKILLHFLAHHMGEQVSCEFISLVKKEQKKKILPLNIVFHIQVFKKSSLRENLLIPEDGERKGKEIFDLHDVTELLNYPTPPDIFCCYITPSIPIFLSCCLYSWRKSTWKQHFPDFLASWFLVASVKGKAFAKTRWREERRQVILSVSGFSIRAEGDYRQLLFSITTAGIWRWLGIPETPKGTTSF